MSLLFYAHPFSSYCQKVAIVLYENDTPFTLRVLSPEEPANFAELEARWPVKTFPMLVDAGRTVVESSIIIEHLCRYHPGPSRLIPDDPKTLLEVRLMDRFFDLYVMTPMQKIVGNFLRPDGEGDPYGVAEAKTKLQTAYSWLDGVMADRTWAVGDAFTMADCAAAPSLFYADWVQEIDAAFPHARAYRMRLLARPSVARAVDEARPYRPFFPPGAPDRD